MKYTLSKDFPGAGVEKEHRTLKGNLVSARTVQSASLCARGPAEPASQETDTPEPGSSE